MVTPKRSSNGRQRSLGQPSPGDTHAVRAIQRRWRLFHQHLQDPAEEVHMRGAARPDVRPEAARAEAFGDGERHAADQRQHHHLRAADVEKGFPQVKHVAVPRPRHQRRGFAREAQHAVRDEHALRPARRAGGVHDGEWRIDGNRRYGGVRSGGLLGQRQRAGFDRHCRPWIGTAGGNGLHQIGFGNDDARPGVRQHVGQIVAHGLDVHGDPDRTDARDRKHHGERRLTVAQHERDTVSRLRAVAAKPVGQHRRAPVERTEGQGAFADAGKDAPGRSCRKARKQRDKTVVRRREPGR
jgi:hypothetical protein